MFQLATKRHKKHKMNKRTVQIGMRDFIKTFLCLFVANPVLRPAEFLPPFP